MTEEKKTPLESEGAAPEATPERTKAETKVSEQIKTAPMPDLLFESFEEETSEAPRAEAMPEPTLADDAADEEEGAKEAREEQPEKKDEAAPGEEKPKKRFRFPFFWVIYGVLLIAFGVLLHKGASFLNRYLTAFEASQPIYCAEEVFNRYFTGEDFETALREAGYEDGVFETVAAASDKLEAKKEGKEVSFYAGATIGEELRYNVILTDPEEGKETAELEETSTSPEPVKSPEKIATIYLKKKSVADEFGNVGYEYSHIEMYVKPEESVKVTVPRGHRLFLNGKEVEEAYVVEETQHSFNDYVPESANKISYLTYEVGELYLEPTLSLLDRFGRDQTLTWEEKTEIFTAPIVYDDDLEEIHKDRIFAGMKEFAKYMQNDGWIANVRQYFDTTSELYLNIAYNMSQFVLYHDGYDFENVFIGEFYEFDEETFCCHVSFDHVLHRAGREDYVDRVDNIVFARKIGNNFYIYNRIVL